MSTVVNLLTGVLFNQWALSEQLDDCQCARRDGLIPDPEGCWLAAPNQVFANRVPAAGTLRVNRIKGSFGKRREGRSQRTGRIWETRAQEKVGKDLWSTTTGPPEDIRSGSGVRGAVWGRAPGPASVSCPCPETRPRSCCDGVRRPPPCLTHPHRDRPTPCQPPGRAPTWSRVFWVAQALTTDGMECSRHLAFKCPQESTSREQYGNIHKKRQGSMTLPQKRILRCIQTYTMTGMEGCAF